MLGGLRSLTEKRIKILIVGPSTGMDIEILTGHLKSILDVEKYYFFMTDDDHNFADFITSIVDDVKSWDMHPTFPVDPMVGTLGKHMQIEEMIEWCDLAIIFSKEKRDKYMLEFYEIINEWASSLKKLEIKVK